MLRSNRDHVDLTGAALLINEQGDEPDRTIIYCGDPYERLPTGAGIPHISGLRGAPVRVHAAENRLPEHLLEGLMHGRPGPQGEIDHIINVACPHGPKYQIHDEMEVVPTCNVTRSRVGDDIATAQGSRLGRSAVSRRRMIQPALHEPDPQPTRLWPSADKRSVCPDCNPAPVYARP